jgi:hypothetical protein
VTVREQTTDTLLLWLDNLGWQGRTGMNRRVRLAHDVRVGAIRLVLRERGVTVPGWNTTDDGRAGA